MNSKYEATYHFNVFTNYRFVLKLNLPSPPVNAVIKDDKTGNLFCGTDLGVYIIKDGCKKWLALNANIPASASVQDLLIHPSDRKLIIATYGRGVYAWDDVNVLK